jgi:hypothetical protein
VYERLRPEAVTITDFVFCDQHGQRLLELPATGNEKPCGRRCSGPAPPSPCSSATPARATGRGSRALRLASPRAHRSTPIIWSPETGRGRRCANRCWGIRSTTWA